MQLRVAQLRVDGFGLRVVVFDVYTTSLFIIFPTKSFFY